MTTLFGQALMVATQAHDGASYGDQPYIVHPWDVAHCLRRSGASEVLIAAGLCHDVIEDSSDFPHRQALRNALAPAGLRWAEEVSFLVDSLTHDEDQSYEGYIEEIIPEAQPVKFFDSYSNLIHLPEMEGKWDPKNIERKRERYISNLRRFRGSIGAAHLDMRWMGMSLNLLGV